MSPTRAALFLALCVSFLFPLVAVAEEPFLGKITEASLDAMAKKHGGKTVEAQNWMVSAANPHAVEAGAKVLESGGTAADAMIAVQAVLGLVEPQSSGLGGGAFLIWYDAASGKVTTLDGRETAPLAATPRLFQDDSGEPLSFFQAVVGGRSVGVPATPMLMEAAHERWGKSDWNSLFDHAKTLSKEGFTVSQRMADLVAFDAPRLAVHPSTAAYFLPDGKPVEAGDTLRNPAYGITLDALAEKGADVFYAGRLAEEIIATVTGVAKNPGVLSAVDLSIYKVKERAPVCVEYHGHDVCGMGPPSSGALTVGQILKLVEPYDLHSLGADNPESWRLIGDASRLAFSDRGRYMADEDFVPVPRKGLVSEAYMAERSALLATDQALENTEPGTPEFDHSHLLADDESIEFPSTSHISIVDSYGNALSMTTTVENIFGSRLMAGGFILNNELTDFSFRSHRDGVPIANRVEPGKRPRSSMSPTIVLKDGKPILVIGSPGGSRIIGFVAQTVIAHLDWGMDVQQAISMPRFINRYGKYEVEEGTPAADLAPALEGLGYEVSIKPITSGLHGISIDPNRLQGGADPRREGIALGG